MRNDSAGARRARMRDNSRMRAIAIACATVLAAGCGGGGDDDVRVTDQPPACAGDAPALVKALTAAPGRVRVDGEPISHCFTRNQNAADLQALGTGMLRAAQQLGDQAATSSDSALRLGYLIGAARRGLKRNGVAAEMVRRLEGETGKLGANAAAYQRGLRAGLRQG